MSLNFLRSEACVVGAGRGEFSSWWVLVFANNNLSTAVLLSLLCARHVQTGWRDILQLQVIVGCSGRGAVLLSEGGVWGTSLSGNKLCSAGDINWVWALLITIRHFRNIYFIIIYPFYPLFIHLWLFVNLLFWLFSILRSEYLGKNNYDYFFLKIWIEVPFLFIRAFWDRDCRITTWKCCCDELWTIILTHSVFKSLFPWFAWWDSFSGFGFRCLLGIRLVFWRKRSKRNEFV